MKIIVMHMLLVQDMERAVRFCRQSKNDTQLHIKDCLQNEIGVTLGYD